MFVALQLDTLSVRRFPPGSKEKDLEDLFNSHTGNGVSKIVMSDSADIAYIAFLTHDEAMLGHRLNRNVFCGHELIVNFVKPDPTADIMYQKSEQPKSIQENNGG